MHLPVSATIAIQLDQYCLYLAYINNNEMVEKSQIFPTTIVREVFCFREYLFSYSAPQRTRVTAQINGH